MNKQSIAHFLFGILLVLLASSCEKELNDVHAVSIGINMKFDKYTPGDSLLLGQVLEMTGQGLIAIEQVTATDQNKNTFTIDPSLISYNSGKISIQLQNGTFNEGQYKLAFKRKDGEWLIGAPPVNLFNFALSAYSGFKGEEVAVTATAGLATASKVLFTSAEGFAEATFSAPKTASTVAFKIPDNAVSGPLFLELDNPADPANPVRLQATGNFGVMLPEPEITGVSATNGAWGTEVTITGKNFGAVGPNNKYFYDRNVYFAGPGGNRIPGFLSTGPGNQTESQIKVLVPYFAETGNMEVEVQYQAAQDAHFFTIDNAVISKQLFFAGVNGVMVNLIHNDGHSAVVPVTGIPSSTQIAFDEPNKRLYYSGGAGISYIDLTNGTNTDVLFESGVTTIEVKNNKLFWVLNDNALFTADIDGSNKQELLNSPNYLVYKIAATPDAGTLSVLYTDFSSGNSLSIGKFDVASATITEWNYALTESSNIVAADSNYLYCATNLKVVRLPLTGLGTVEEVYATETEIIWNFGIDKDGRMFWTQGGGDLPRKLMSLEPGSTSPQVIAPSVEYVGNPAWFQIW